MKKNTVLPVVMGLSVGVAIFFAILLINYKIISSENGYLIWPRKLPDPS